MLTETVYLINLINSSRAFSSVELNNFARLIWSLDRTISHALEGCSDEAITYLYFFYRL